MLFALEGTIVVKKDVVAEKFSDDLPIRNLEVMKLLQSFASRGYVSETFNWQYHYYILTDEGIKYLRDYLGLPEDIVPATLKKPAVNAIRQSAFSRNNDDKRRGDRPPFNKDRAGGDRAGGDRSGYRRKEVA